MRGEGADKSSYKLIWRCVPNMDKAEGGSVVADLSTGIHTKRESNTGIQWTREATVREVMINKAGIVNLGLRG